MKIIELKRNGDNMKTDIFGMMFFKMSKKHTKRILGYEAIHPFWHFFDLKAYMIMACMMGEELDLEQLESFRISLLPSFIQDLVVH